MNVIRTGLVALCAAVFAASAWSADILAQWTDFTGADVSGGLAPQISATANGITGSAWRLSANGGTVNIDGTLSTGTTIPPKIDFVAPASIDIGRTGKPLTVVLLLKTPPTEAVIGKPFAHFGNGSAGVGVSLYAIDTSAQTATLRGSWQNNDWAGGGTAANRLAVVNSIAATDGYTAIAVSAASSSTNTQILEIQNGTVTRHTISGLTGTGITATGVTFGGYANATSGGMNYTLFGVTILNGGAGTAGVPNNDILAAVRQMATIAWAGTTVNTANTGTWDTTSGNTVWRLKDRLVPFATNDAVTFADLADVTTATVSVSGNVSPSAILVDNSATAYTIGSTASANNIQGGVTVTKRGAGALTLQGGSTSTNIAKLVVKEGTVTLGSRYGLTTRAANQTAQLVIEGGTFNINGQGTFNTDGSGYLTQKTITMGGPTASRIEGGAVTFYSSENNNALTYVGGDTGANVPATFAANVHGVYTNSTLTRNLTVGQGTGSTEGGAGYDLEMSGTLGLSGGQFGGTTLVKKGLGILKLSGANNLPRLTVSEGTLLVAHASALSATTAVNGTLDLGGVSPLVTTLSGSGTITSATAATLTVGGASTFAGTVSGQVGLTANAALTLSGTVDTEGTLTVADGVTLTLSGTVTRVGGLVSTGTGAFFFPGTTTVALPAVPSSSIVLDTAPWATLESGTYTLLTLPSGTTIEDWTAVVALKGDVPVGVTVVTTANTYGIRVTKGAELTWMPFGDSITEGESSAISYRHALWEKLSAAGYNIRAVGMRNTTKDGVRTDEKWSWHNAWYGAFAMPIRRTSTSLYYNLDTALEAGGYPDIITVLIGTNDAASYSGDHDRGDQNFDTRFLEWQTFIGRMATLRPHAQILVSTPPKTQNAANNTLIQSLGDKMREAYASGSRTGEPFLSHANVHFVDLWNDADLVAGSDFHDQTHPNASGCEKIAAVWSTEVQKVLGPNGLKDVALIPVEAFNPSASTVTVRFNKPLKSEVAGVTATLTGTNAPTLSSPVLGEDGRTVTFTASTSLPTLTELTLTVSGVTATDESTSSGSIVFTALGSGAAANVPEAFRSGFLHRKTLNLAEDVNLASADPTYESGADTASSVPAVKRVAYYMELKRPGKPAQFVWASMDAFDVFEEKLGVPSAVTGMHQTEVTGLRVFGNRGNFTNTTAAAEEDVRGIVEFTPYTYSGNETAFTSVPDLYQGKNAYGWRDTLSFSGNGHGCMQVARVVSDSAAAPTWAAAEMLFAYNGFNTAIADDLGIGSFATNLSATSGGVTQNFDWTSITATGIEGVAPGAYEVRRLEIWVEPVQTRTWAGAASGTWDKTATDIWTEGTAFADSMKVAFGTLTSGTEATVTVGETVAPAVLDVTMNAYTFDGTNTTLSPAGVTVASGASASFALPLGTLADGVATYSGALSGEGTVRFVSETPQSVTGAVSAPLAVGGGIAMTELTLPVVGGKTVTVNSDSTLIHSFTGNQGAEGLDLSGITGMGTLRLASTVGYYSLSPNNGFGGTLALENATANGILFKMNTWAGKTLALGGLSGSGDFRSDFDTNVNSVTVSVAQRADSTYSGRFVTGAANRNVNLTVSSSVTPRKTLTLSGQNASWGTLTVAETGRVHLSGSWAGMVVVNAGGELVLDANVNKGGFAVAVNGTLTGAGSLTGNAGNANATITLGATARVAVADGQTLTLTPGNSQAVSIASDATLVAAGGTLVCTNGITITGSGTVAVALPDDVTLGKGQTRPVLRRTAPFTADDLAKFTAPAGCTLYSEGSTFMVGNLVTIDKPSETPEGTDFSGAAVSAVNAAIAAASGMESVTMTTVSVVTGGKTPVSDVATVNNVLGCFSGVATAVADAGGTTATVTVAYDFGISAITTDRTTVTVTAKVQGAAGNTAAAFADGVVFTLIDTTKTEGEEGREITPATTTKNPDGTVALTTPDQARSLYLKVKVSKDTP